MNPSYIGIIGFVIGAVFGGILFYNAGWECRGIEERKRRFVSGKED